MMKSMLDSGVRGYLTQHRHHSEFSGSGDAHGGAGDPGGGVLVVHLDGLERLVTMPPDSSQLSLDDSEAKTGPPGHHVDTGRPGVSGRVVGLD